MIFEDEKIFFDFDNYTYNDASDLEKNGELYEINEQFCSMRKLLLLQKKIIVEGIDKKKQMNSGV